MKTKCLKPEQTLGLFLVNGLNVLESSSLIDQKELDVNYINCDQPITIQYGLVDSTTSNNEGHPVISFHLYLTSIYGFSESEWNQRILMNYYSKLTLDGD